MSERYSKIISLPKNLYSTDSPIIISAGALYKDNHTNDIVVQLKFKNIVNQKIKALTVALLSFDSLGEFVNQISYEYPDLDIPHGMESGQKVLIKLPNNTTRSVSLSVGRVIFEDNSVWIHNDEEWTPIVTPNSLNSIITNSETEKQFKLEYGKNCKYEVTEDRDLWICSCGQINKLTKNKCNCGCCLDSLKNADLSQLCENARKRLAMTRKRIIIIASISLLALFAIFYAVEYTKNYTYKQGIELISSNSESDMIKGLELLIKQPEYKDSKKVVFQALTTKHESFKKSDFSKITTLETDPSFDNRTMQYLSSHNFLFIGFEDSFDITFTTDDYTLYIESINGEKYDKGDCSFEEFLSETRCSSLYKIDKDFYILIIDFSYYDPHSLYYGLLVDKEFANSIGY